MMGDYEDLMMRNGIDYAEAMERFGGNATLFERLALKFLNDPHFGALEEALAAGDAETAYREAHSLKGVAGNLSFTELYEASSRVSDALKKGDPAAAKLLMTRTRKAHASVTAALREMAGDKTGPSSKP